MPYTKYHKLFLYLIIVMIIVGQPRVVGGGSWELGGEKLLVTFQEG